MNDPRLETIQAHDADDQIKEESDQSAATDLQDWQTPQLEDVSEQVMAQPYIRFT